ncbi:chemotaxis protein CheA [Chryseolinea sp. T2]|uniref:chemotaxis protein CheA n=1 Tax=Chryseolinea sp. T2 TaxID=3129255 RepID=UPI0030778CDF
MANRDDEYKEIFLAEALDNFEEVNRLITHLEKHAGDKETVHALFRITHTLKGNALGMGYSGIAEMSHVLEDLFGEMRDGRVLMDESLFAMLFKAVDALGNLIQAIRDNSEVKYKGIKTKLEVYLKRTKAQPVTASIHHRDAEKASFSEAGIDDNETSNAGQRVNEPEQAEKLAFSDLVQVPVRKLDNLLTLVGELMIEKDRILAMSSASGRRGNNEFARLSRISADLQYSVMDVRLVQVGFLFNKFHRVVRDAATIEGKDVVLKLEGTDTEIDRNVLQVIGDSLIHLIRNCVGHGIETPEERKAAGKQSEGTVTLSARGETDSVVIEISDDGRGLNYQKIKEKAIAKGLLSASEADSLSKDELGMLIFEPGFSTMERVTAIAGRGVGMDVVKKTLDSIGGLIKLMSTDGAGMVIQLTLPASMAVKSSLLFELGESVYAIPLAYTQSVISVAKSDIHRAGGGLVANHLGKNIAITFLSDILELNTHTGSNMAVSSLQRVPDSASLHVVVVSFNNRTVGFVVDKLLQQKEIVEKPLTRPVDRVKHISGYTILGSGNVCLVLNVPFVLGIIFNNAAQQRAAKAFHLN